MEEKKLIANTEIKKTFDDAINLLLKKKRGSVIAINGEEGYGKSFILEFLSNQIKENEQIVAGFADNQSPLSDLNIGKIQPLQPFATIVRQIMEQTSTAKKKFFMNLGITTLATLPLIGDIFYAVKEYGRDWREYKNDKSSENFKNLNKIVADFYDTLVSQSDKKPLAIFIDNIHYADDLSLKLLEQLIENIKNISILIVFTYQEFETNTILTHITETYCREHEQVSCFKLSGFNLQEIREFGKQNIKNFKPNSIFEEWLYEKTKGIPGLLKGYAEHFTYHSPFDENGNLIYELDNKLIFPENAKSALETYLKTLSDKEINLLGICAAEGMEFTAFLISNLLNTDIVSTIKKLRRIQNKVNIFSSMGPKIKYGLKTTIYKFDQEYYYKYFENLLEYEEKIAIHGQIASILKTKLDESTNSKLHHELAPYIASHSIVSGDNETAKQMLVLSAQAANEIDSKEIIENVYQAFQALSADDNPQNGIAENAIFQELLQNTSANLSDNKRIPGVSSDLNEGYGESRSYPIDFSFIRRTIVDEYHKKKFLKALELINTFLKTQKENLKPSEESQLLSLAAKCYIEMNDLETAKEYVQQSLEILKEYKEPIPKSFALNVKAIIKIQEDKIEEAYAILQKAAKISINLPPEIKLITLANIALLLKTTDAKKSERYFVAIRKLTKMLNYDEFAIEVLK